MGILDFFKIHDPQEVAEQLYLRAGVINLTPAMRLLRLRYQLMLINTSKKIRYIKYI